MILFDTFTPVDGSPIYLQIVTFIKRGAIAGSIRDGDELPSRRVLSALLGINPNTVQKAFRLLEEEQLIESRTGARSCMTLDEEKLRRLKKDMLAQDIRGVIEALKQMGISKQDALQLIDENWEDLL
ncbi:MAG: GntR family transcriptional regulator [Lachnospiraceae bacterium]|nr:GntR family transcriptional regulator [Lachnospiraceae bacterium]